MISQIPMEAGENKIIAALRLLECTAIEGKTISGDAIFSQKKACETAIKKGADFLFRVKNNQKTRRREIAKQFEIKPSGDAAASAKLMGAPKQGLLRATDVPPRLKEWPGVRQIAMEENK